MTNYAAEDPDLSESVPSGSRSNQRVTYWFIFHNQKHETKKNYNSTLVLFQLFAANGDDVPVYFFLHLALQYQYDNISSNMIFLGR
jgi:hypothetical protein